MKTALFYLSATKSLSSHYPVVWDGVTFWVRAQVMHRDFARPRPLDGETFLGQSELTEKQCQEHDKYLNWEEEIFQEMRENE